MYTTVFASKMKKSGSGTTAKSPENPKKPLFCLYLTVFLSKSKKNAFCRGRQKTFFRWGKVDSNHRSQWQQIYSLPPLAAREFPLELVIGVEPTTCWLQISCSAIEPHQHSLIFLRSSPDTPILYHAEYSLSTPFFRVFVKASDACKLPLYAV